jgi:hypothetical protein
MRQDLLERYRDINTFHDWYAWTLEDFASQMRDNYGVEVRNIHFSGFWSQGDGASFEISYTDVWNLLGKIGCQDKYPAWGLGEHGFQVTRYHSRYSHSGTMQGNVDAGCDCHDNTRDVVYAAVSNEYCAIRSNQIGEVEAELLSFFRDKADDLYRRLEEEYEYLTSDEAVWDTIRANGLDEETEDETE